MLLAGVAVAAFGAFMARGDTRGGGYFLIGVSALMALAALTQLFGGSHLKLTAHGMEERALFRTHRTAWSDIACIRIFKVRSHGMKAGEGVGFNYAPHYTKSKAARALSAAITGCEAGLHDTYGMTADDLAATLETWRRRNTGR